MANGRQSLMSVPARVTSANALRVQGDTGATTGSTSSLGSLLGASAAAADGLPVLLVVFTT